MTMTKGCSKFLNVTVLYIFVFVFNANIFHTSSEGMPYDCPNECSGIGICRYNETAHNGYHCDCPTGFRRAPDCSERDCPKGPYFFSKTRTISAPHDTEVVCSGVGKCGAGGLCECMEGFKGTACEMNVCPTVSDFDCNSKGRCISMNDFSKQEGFDPDGDGTGMLYSLWDGPFTHGCICDWNFLGPDCSIINCPRGHDPATNETVYHIVKLTTGAASGALTGTFRIGFYGHYFLLDSNANTATASVLKTELEALGNIKTVDVTRGTVDTNTNGAVYSITFTSWPTKPQENNIYNHDGVPDINLFHCQVYNAGATDPTCVWADVQTGTYRNDICSARGTCDFTTGECTCADEFFGHNCDRFNHIYALEVQNATGKAVSFTHTSYTGDALILETKKQKESDFSFFSVLHGTKKCVDIRGDGVATVALGGMKSSTGNITLAAMRDTRLRNSINVTSHITLDAPTSNTAIVRLYNSLGNTYDTSLIETLGTGTEAAYNVIQGSANGTSLFRLTGAGELALYSTVQSTGVTTGTLTHTGGFGIGKKLYVGSLVSKITTAATNKLTGSMIAAGGLAVGKKLYVGGAFALTMSTSLKTVFPTLKASTQTMPLSAHDYSIDQTQRSGTPLVYFNAKINTNVTSGLAVTDGNAMIVTQTASSSFTGSLLKMTTTVASANTFEFMHFITTFNAINWTYAAHGTDGATEFWYQNISGTDALSVKGDGSMIAGGGIHAAQDSTVTGNFDIVAGGISNSGGDILLTTTSATTMTHTGAAGNDLTFTSTNGDVIMDNIRFGHSDGLSSSYWGLKVLTAQTTLTSTDSGSKVLLNSADGFTLTLPDCSGSSLGWNFELHILLESSSAGYTIVGGLNDIFSGFVYLAEDTQAYKTKGVVMASGANAIYLKAGDGTKPGKAGTNLDFICRAADTYHVTGTILSDVDSASGSAVSANTRL